MDINHLKQKFIDEADSLLTSFDNILILLEKDPSNIQHISEAFRIMHTIKGASGMFGFENIVEMTHEIESLYDLVRNQNIEVSQTLLDITFAAADHIRTLLMDETLQNNDILARHQLLKENIALFKSDANPSPVPKIAIQDKENSYPDDIKKDTVVTWNVIFYPNDDLIKRCINIVYTFQDLFALGEYRIVHKPLVTGKDQYWSIFLISDKPYDEIEGALMFVMDFCKITKVAEFNIFDTTSLMRRDQEIIQLEEARKSKDEKNQTLIENNNSAIQQNLLAGMNSIPANTPVLSTKNITTHIQVDATKLDTLMYLVSELVTTKSELLISLKKQNETMAFTAAEKIEKLSKLFSENALSIRLVSLEEMLQKFKRLIRDLSKQLEKEIDFVIMGEDTELDKNIVDALSEPIMHLIRNNIDHGIELPEKRIENGKPSLGTIRFEATKSGNYVYIAISDDGKGIDEDFIYNKALEKGFISAGTQLSQKETLDLIFVPGFSTAQSLSNVSGRGVGMDIVLKKIQEIRGEISVDTLKGVGTTFTIKVQQTISIIDTLLISSGNITYAIPMEDIEACGLEKHENITHNQNHLISYEEELIPYINLQEWSSTENFLAENEKLVIINKKNKRYAIIIENIIGEFQAVIKPLGETFQNILFLSGASLLGDGSIALLLDTDKLYHAISKKEFKTTHSKLLQ